VLLCAGGALSSAGCDTVAEISFKRRDFNGASATGFTNAVDCTSTDTELNFRFSPFDGDSILIAPGENVNSVRIDIEGDGRNFISEDIEFFQSFLFPSPDIDCSSDDDCSDPYSCEPINPFNPDGARFGCGMSIEVETFQGNVRFDEGSSEIKTIALLMDYSGSLEGTCEDGRFCPHLSTDRNDQRISAAQTFVLKFSRGGFADDSRMCVVSLGGDGRAAVNFLETVDNCLTGDYNSVRDRVNTLAIGETGRSPVWSAVLETVLQQLDGTQGDRHIVLFTDGVDDGSLADTFEDARAAALDADVQVHVLQLDNPPEDEETEIVPHLGPIDEYIQIACETGGSYQYAQGPEDLRTMFQNLAVTIGASYEIRAQVAATAGDNIDPGCYRVATGVRITMANTQRTIQLAGDMTDTATRNIIDQRLVVCRRPVPPPVVEEEEEEEEEGEGE
jgi:hypothetical protein